MTFLILLSMMKNRLKLIIFWESNFENVFFVGAILKMYFLREQFWGRNFWKYFDKYLSLGWLITSFSCLFANLFTTSENFMILTRINISPELFIKLVAKKLRIWTERILRINAIPKEILCFPRYGLGVTWYPVNLIKWILKNGCLSSQ